MYYYSLILVFDFWMVCRRLLVDDDRGVDEALNETVCTSYGCAGLVVSIPEKNLMVVSICFAFLYRSWRSSTFLQHSASIMTPLLTV